MRPKRALLLPPPATFAQSQASPHPPVSGLCLLSDLCSNSPPCLASTWSQQVCAPQPHTLLCSDSFCHFWTNLFPSHWLLTDSTFPPSQGGTLSKSLNKTREEGFWRTTALNTAVYGYSYGHVTQTWESLLWLLVWHEKGTSPKWSTSLSRGIHLFVDQTWQLFPMLSKWMRIL